MKTLVTGANGFVGATLVRELLRQGHQVRGVEHPDVNLWRLNDIRAGDIEVVRADLLQADTAKWRQLLNDVDTCIHCAWEATPGKYLYAPDNTAWLETTRRLFQAAPDTTCRHMTGIGTCFEYDTSAGLLSEQTPLAPSTPYAIAKAAAFTEGRRRLAATSVRFLWVRLFYLLGPREAPQRLIPDIIHRLLCGEPAPLTEGTQIRDFIGVEDAARTICRLIAIQAEGAVNVASGTPITVRQLATLTGELMGCAHLLRFGERAPNVWDPPVVTADVTHLRQILGASHTVDLQQSIREAIAWWRAQRPTV
jgi:dTDP-6-deoxy-L-talose 4-dehydrogenase (NAD+)